VKLVADTNTLISGSLWNGPAARLLDAIRAGQVVFVQSPLLWAEFVEVLSRPKFSARLRLLGFTPTMLADGLRQYVAWTAATTIPLPAALRDPKDIIVLAAAAAGKVDAIVSGDHDLLSMKLFENIPILAVRETLASLGIPAE
jgi:putative PIN family toxin of toxin-antitoxin system